MSRDVCTLPKGAQAPSQVKPVNVPRASGKGEQLHELAAPRSPYPQTDPIEKHPPPVIGERRLMKLGHGLAKSRVNRETVCALAASSVSSATTRPTARVLSPRKNASRINSSTSAARRSNRTRPAGKKARCRVRATGTRTGPRRVTTSCS
jgi:hypothetical protein